MFLTKIILISRLVYVSYNTIHFVNVLGYLSKNLLSSLKPVVVCLCRDRYANDNNCYHIIIGTRQLIIYGKLSFDLHQSLIAHAIFDRRQLICVWILGFSKEKKSKSYSVNVPLENVSLNANGSPPYDPHVHRILEHPTT